jgi:hypothetical protein
MGSPLVLLIELRAGTSVLISKNCGPMTFALRST